MTVAATFCATLVDEWGRAGLTHAVVSPGSRSTPMVLALAAEPSVHLHVCLDERTAGFYALGVGLRTGTPALVVTTSGTAAVELHPAVTEAHQAGVPLLVVTADRPPESQGVGAPQTIEQADLYGRSVRWRADPGVPDADHRAQLAFAGVARRRPKRGGVAGRPGPVHLNLAFREPLDARPGPLPTGARRRAPLASGTCSAPHRSAGAGRAGTPIVGPRRGSSSRARAPGIRPRSMAWRRCSDGRCWPMPARRRALPRAATVAAFDSLLRHRRFADGARPEVVLRLGAPPASRLLAAWLASSESTQVAVESYGTWLDPDHSADVVVAADPAEVCAGLGHHDLEPAPAAWTRLWSGAEHAAQDAIDDVLAGHREPTEPGVARALISCLPQDAGLVVASSMPIRDVEWFAQPRPDIRVMANRGVNGIDGTLSTMLGVAAGASGRPTACLLGDLAFLHDAGALVGAAHRGLDAVAVVIDNKGGGIFSFLPQAASVPAPVFERLFATPHDVDLVALARLHGLSAVEVSEADDVAPTVRSGMDAGGVSVIVVRTDRRANVAVHEELHGAVSSCASTPSSIDRDTGPTTIASRPDDGGEHGLELELGLGQLGLGVRTGHNTPACDQSGLAALQVRGADADGPATVSVRVHPPHRSRRSNPGRGSPPRRCSPVPRPWASPPPRGWDGWRRPDPTPSGRAVAIDRRSWCPGGPGFRTG